MFVVGLALYLGAAAAASSITGAMVWLRRGAFGLAALVLLISASRSRRVRYRAAVGLPQWFSPVTAIGLDVILPAADLPNAFPYFIAVERLVAASLEPHVATIAISI